jgi:hypothetical protein
VNLIAPFQPRGARLKWRKNVPYATRREHFCAFVELTLIRDALRYFVFSITPYFNFDHFNKRQNSHEFRTIITLTNEKVLHDKNINPASDSP